MRARYKAGSNNLNENLSVAEQSAFVQNLDTVRPCGVSEEAGDVENEWDFEGTMTADEDATSGIREKLQEVQHVCEHECEAVPTTIVDEVELARESNDAKRKNATMPSQKTDLEAELAEIKAAKRATRSKITTLKDWIKVLKTLLCNA